VNYFLERHNYDFEQLSSCITELLLLLLRQLLLRRASYMVTDIVEFFSVAVELPCRRDAIILSLPCSSFELIHLIIATTQEHWGSDQVIFKDNKICLFVLTECTNVTDTPADGRTDTA